MKEIARWDIPLKLGRGGNTRLTPRTQARVAKKQRLVAYNSALAALSPRRFGPNLVALLVDNRFVVTICRCSPSARPCDDDNLAASAKAVRDGIADRLGVDDGDRRLIRWEYTQARADWGVRFIVALEPREP